MKLSVADRNRRKRERRKREKEERRKQEEVSKEAIATAHTRDEEPVVEIEYVAEPVLPHLSDTTTTKPSIPDGLPPGMSKNQEEKEQSESIESVLKRFHERSAVASAAVVSDNEDQKLSQDTALLSDDDGDYEDEGDKKPMSKRKLRELTRPSVADLKRRVKRPDLVEAHDVTSADPEFLIYLKSIDGTVGVPRHWGRKRKYLQGKRGFEKPPFKLPDFIIKTGIAEIRDTVAEDEAKQSAKQKNRSRVNPKMGSMDVDYKTLYEAFFKYQTKPTDLTKFGDLYYEGKELETSTDLKPGGPYSKALREALGMMTATTPPPWLINMQRYGPPPSYPNLAIPGLNAPLPNDQCQYGYHTGGWGKPPVDGYGRPLYGGNPFDPPGSGKQDEIGKAGIVTSDGKTIAKSPWGALPTGDLFQNEESDVDESSSGEESSGDEMEESDEEAEEVPESGQTDGFESVMAPPPTTTAPGDLRKQSAGEETPMQLYKVLEQHSSTSQQGGVFQSDVQYVVPGKTSSGAVPEGAESVLSKAMPPGDGTNRKRKHDDDDEDLGKNFKF
eukprot:scaffold381_cov138-Cylindrotheca_fusiformis.AAC.19